MFPSRGTDGHHAKHGHGAWSVGSGRGAGGEGLLTALLPLATRAPSGSSRIVNSLYLLTYMVRWRGDEKHDRKHRRSSVRKVQ